MSKSVFLPNGMVWHVNAIDRYRRCKTYSQLNRAFDRLFYTRSQRKEIVHYLHKIGLTFS